MVQKKRIACSVKSYHIRCHAEKTTAKTFQAKKRKKQKL